MSLLFALIGSGYVVTLGIAGLLYLVRPRKQKERATLQEVAPELFPEEED